MVVLSAFLSRRTKDAVSIRPSGVRSLASEIVVSIGDDVDLLARFDVYNIALAPLAFFAEV